MVDAETLNRLRKWNLVAVVDVGSVILKRHRLQVPMKSLSTMTIHDKSQQTIVSIRLIF